MSQKLAEARCRSGRTARLDTAITVPQHSLAVQAVAQSGTTRMRSTSETFSSRRLPRCRTQPLSQALRHLAHALTIVSIYARTRRGTCSVRSEAAHEVIAPNDPDGVRLIPLSERCRLHAGRHRQPRRGSPAGSGDRSQGRSSFLAMIILPALSAAHLRVVPPPFPVD